jgi:hypothetical protein
MIVGDGVGRIELRLVQRSPVQYWSAADIGGVRPDSEAAQPHPHMSGADRLSGLAAGEKPWRDTCRGSE